MNAMLAALPLLASSTFGEISGDLRLGDKYLAAAKVELACGQKAAAAVTDSLGTFRVAVAATGRCTVTVTHEKQTASLDIVVFDKPSRYRLVLELKDGKYALKRV
jgi:hypothetical protein